MTLLIQGGAVITAEQSFRADVLCQSGMIAPVGPGLEIPSDAQIAKPGGVPVMPGSIDPHTHMGLPFMGTTVIEDRLNVLWHHGPGTGRLTTNKFVRITSASTAQIFDLYPRKGAVQPGADADPVVRDSEGSRTISVKTHHQNIDFNSYEGMQVTDLARHTISQGYLVWTDGDLRTVHGAGRYIERPYFATPMQAAALRNALRVPVQVERG